MDVLLHKHNAKHVCEPPDGLPELCADICREVIRSQPDDIYCFIADYLDTLLITRENAKVAIKIVQSVTMKSEHIVEILVDTGLRLEEIAAVAPRLQKAFKVYLNAVDERKKECGCDVDSDIDDENEISICQILRKTGASYPDAQRAAIKIQALFRGHHKRMSLAESRGEVQWQRAAANTVDLLRKSGVTRAQATHAATIIQAAYRGYYTRKNLKIKRARDGKEPRESVDMCAWFRMMFEESGITAHRANQAAIVIQVAYRQYRKRKSGGDQLAVSSEASKKAAEPLERKKDVVPEEDHPKSVKSEVKSEVKSHSEIADTEDEPDDDDDDAKTITEVKEEQAEEEEAVEIKQEQPDTSDAEENIEKADEAEEETVKEEEEEEEEEENKGDEVKAEGDEEENKDDEANKSEETEESKGAQVEEQGEEEKTEAAEE